MAKVKIQGHASGTGVLTVTAPNTSTDRTITLPDATGTLATTGEVGATSINGLSDAVISADNNIGLGSGAVDSITTGDANTGVGINSLTANTTGQLNTAVGYESLLSNVSGQRLTAVGKSALQNNTGSFNTAVGSVALENNTSGQQNTALGDYALNANTTASSNTALGQGAMMVNTTGYSNVSVGTNAMAANTTGKENTVIGTNAMDANTTASNNAAFGYAALGANTTGASNTAVGYESLLNNTTANQNTALGNASLMSATTGNDNVAAGYKALKSVTTGTHNIGIGHRTGDYQNTLTTGHFNILIGGYCHTSGADASRQIVMGDSVVGSAENSLTIGNGGTDSAIAFGATSISAPSDERLKEEITTSTAGLSFVNDLRPVTFKWKKEKDIPTNMNGYVEGSETRYKTDTTEHGFIAQEVKAAIDAHSEIKDGFDMWAEDDNGGRQRIADGALIPILVKAVQELSAKVTALESE